ncbi:MAG: energy transducer TonB [Bacteroidales bacterium]|nr:energy transducer TonB [Bacteroidales bacterium]MDD6141094.1 energy transducer TonB [Bacteroidales bacterium]MDD6623093.1 energy transducer TonB [Bacteroidales bacterium]MDD6669594.1 energy transducer TonB [Bacteroidales bacterium]MDY4943088.1 energy transducer TonB [Candidatus Limisoma sp.]
MARNVDLTSKEWCDVVFENRNKEFGAYQLRLNSKPRHLRAFLFTLIGAIAIIIIAYSYMKVAAYIEEQRIMDQANQELVAVDLAAEEQEEEQEPEETKFEQPEEQALPEEILNTVKVTELLIAADEEVKAEDEIKSQDELKETQTAFGQTDFDKGTDDRNVIREHKEEVIVEKKEEVKEPEKVFTAVEQMPQFPGGEAELMKYLSKNIKYPTMAMENNIQGRVVVQFVVTKTGSIGEVKVVRSVDRDLDREAIRVCKSLPKFTPGKMNGQAVNVWYTLPVNFKLQGVN